MLQEGSIAPDFTLTSDQDTTVTLSSLLGKWVLVYFYPKDDTPGCTKEACMITEVYDDFQKAGIVVLGISHDIPESHAKFKEKYHLPFTLLSDPKKDVIKAYGAKGGFMTRRISYLINPDGMVVKAYPKVDPANHAMEILKDFEKIKKDSIK